MDQRLEEFQRRIGYRFHDETLLKQALTHSSYSNETGAKNHHLLCNERLEFFGDSILQVLTSQYLYHRFPELPEGQLSGIRSLVVCEDALATFSQKIGLGNFLLLGKGERNMGGSGKPALIADAFEALLAAIFLDAGGDAEGLMTVKTYLIPFIGQAVDALPPERFTQGQADCKSRLQVFVQKQKEKEALEYRIVSESGPDHDKHFEVDVYLGANCIGHGSGHSKQKAEQAAALDALRLFGQK